MNNEYYDSKIILKRIFSVSAVRSEMGIDVAYILKLRGLESGAVFEGATRVRERIKFCRFNSK